MNHYVIIGGGIAGTTAAETLRKQDPAAEITIVSNEAHPLYSRVMLPHYIHGKIPRERVFLRTFEKYAESNIHLVIDTVAAIDTSAKQVRTVMGALYTYTKLLIAGGGITNTTTLSNASEVYHLQTIEDADRIYQLLQDNIDGALNMGLIGGGFITMEFAEFFAKKQWKTHVFLRGDQYFSRTFNLDMSNLLEAHLAEHDIRTHKRLTIESYKDDVATTHENGSFALDALAAGIGIASNFDWASDAGISVGTGVLTNEYLETNVPDVYAAGDCAQYLDTLAGRQLLVGNWMNAQMQGRHVAGVMTGVREPFQLVSSYATHVLGIDIVAVGDADVRAADMTIERDYGDGYTLLLLREGKLVGGSMINLNSDRKAVTALIKAQIDLRPHLNTLSLTKNSLDTLL